MGMKAGEKNCKATQEGEWELAVHRGDRRELA